MKSILSIAHIYAIIIIMFLSTCGSATVTKNNNNTNNEQKILKLFTKEKKDKYHQYLVDISRYTTNGGVYQKKYYKYLIGLAREVAENKKFSIVPNSIGFYYDNKRERTKLYLGIEIDTEKNFSQGYADIAVKLVKKDLINIMNTIYSLKTLFKEQDIIGVLVGWKWKEHGLNQSLNIWMNEKDIFKFQNNQITFEELVRKSSVTNTKGIIFILPL